jgi:hypothetical protein
VVAPPAAPVAPKAPPFPYQWLGRMDDGVGPPQVFLNGPLRSYAVAEGDSPDRLWRIDGVTNGQLQVTWIETGETQTVAAR